MEKSVATDRLDLLQIMTLVSQKIMVDNVYLKSRGVVEAIY